jgi:hypothetical protein
MSFRNLTGFELFFPYVATFLVLTVEFITALKLDFRIDTAKNSVSVILVI